MTVGKTGCRWLVWWVIACLTPAFVYAADSQPLESQVKAAFLLNFTKFVEWPATAFADAESPINICIVGEPAVGSTLEQMVEGETVSGRKLAVRKGASDLAGCHVLFIGKEEKEIPKVSSNARKNVLTVGERDGFLSGGGMINFVVDNRRVRFDINQKAVGNSTLKLSSKLFNVARKVEK